MDMLWVWAMLLLFVGLGLAVLEIFIPSGGILGFLAISSIVASIILAFMENQVAGLAFLATAVFGLPVVVVFALYWWPRTPLGRRVLLPTPNSEDVLPDDLHNLRDLIGHTGRAKSAMLPGGAIVIDGRTMDAVSEGLPIEKGQTVRVIGVQATTLMVRVFEADTPKVSDTGSDFLSRPIDAVGPDPFEEESGA